MWDSRAKPVRFELCSEAGDLIMWDSRTIHCNTPALELVQALPPLELALDLPADQEEEFKEAPVAPAAAAEVEKEKDGGNDEDVEGGNGDDDDAATSSSASLSADQKKWDLLRVVAYICMTPFEKATQDVLHKRFKGHKCVTSLNVQGPTVIIEVEGV